jgi:hypothetical protein
MNGTDRCYLGAVALNNSGVSLVERGHHLQALTVLQDAMFAMREVSTAKSPSRPYAEGDDRSGPTGSLTVSAGEKARQKLGLDGMLRRSSRLLRDQASTGRTASCVKLASEVLEVDVPHLAAMRDCGAPDAALTLIRIDATRCPDLLERDEDDEGEERAACPVLESIVILHNYAVAALLLPPVERALRRSAVNVTSVAFSLACGILNGDLADGAAAFGGPFETLVVLQLAAMVAQSSYQLLLELDNLSEAWQSLSQLQSVRTALDEELHHATFVEDLGAPHAKAA